MTRQLLIVDDSISMRQLVASALEDCGLEVLEAGDGVEALSKLQRSRDVALVISDVNMPGMDGLKLLGTLRRKSQFASLPVVMLTTIRDRNAIGKAQALGASAWFVKPFNPRKLLEKVMELLEQSKDTAEQQPA